jgi:hypothetical protein
MSTRFLLYLLLLLSGIIIGIVRYKHLTIPYKLIFYFITVTFFSELTSRIFVLKIKNSFPVYHFYVILSTTIILLFYFSLFKIKALKIIIASCCLLFILTSAINSVYFQPLLSFPSFSIILSDIIIVCFSLLLFRTLVITGFTSEDKLVYWLNAVILMYFVIQIFNWGAYNYILRHQINTRLISDFGYYINITYYISLVLVLTRAKRIVLNPSYD